MPTTQEDVECELRLAHADGDLRRVATIAISRFGPEVRRFLQARLSSRTHAEDAFLQFSEDYWKGLSGFRFQASMRIWMLVLARNAATRQGKTRRTESPLSHHLEDSVAVRPHARTSTAEFIKSEVKNRMRQLRLQLADDEQALLILRIDRGLAWRELVLVMGEAALDADDDVIKRASARLRTRFQGAKKRLRELAQAEGLISNTRSSADP